MKTNKSTFKSIVIRWLAVLIIIMFAAVVFMVRSRPVVLSYSKTRAQSVMIKAFDEAVSRAISNLNYNYDDLAVISRTEDNMVSSIEIDYAKLNLLRTEISKSVHSILADKSDNAIYIPIGSLLGNEYTAGYGPSLRFNIKFLEIPQLDFESEFISAGINNVLHRIYINANLSYSIIIHGVDDTFTVNMTAVAAQTVIAGAVPDNFTNVVETPNSNVADDIFNFAGK